MSLFALMPVTQKHEKKGCFRHCRQNQAQNSTANFVESMLLFLQRKKAQDAFGFVPLIALISGIVDKTTGSGVADTTAIMEKIGSVNADLHASGMITLVNRVV